MPKETEALTSASAITETAAKVRLARQARNEWHVTIPPGIPPETLLRPDYWKHVTHLFRVGDNDGRGGDIIAVCEDRSWRATFEIRDIGPYHMNLVILKPDSDGVCWFDKLSDLADETTTHYVKWIAPGAVRWGVKRKSDDETIESGFEHKALAKVWMHKHCADIAA